MSGQTLLQLKFKRKSWVLAALSITNEFDKYAIKLSFTVNAVVKVVLMSLFVVCPFSFVFHLLCK